VLAFALLTPVALLAADDPPVTTEEVANLKAYDLAEMADRGPTLNGKLIRLKFNYRAREIDQDKGTIGYYNATNPAKIKSATIVALGPAEGMPWFQRISTDLNSRQQAVVYCSVIRETAEVPRTSNLWGVS
jgi:hypothetical protein